MEQKRASCLFEKTNFLLCFALCKEQKHGQEKTEERGREESRETEDGAAEQKKKKHLGCQFSSCEFVCRAESRHRAGCQKVTYFLFNNLHETFCVRPCAQSPVPLPPLHSLLLHHRLMLICCCCCCPDCHPGPVCGVYTAFAFDKVNQKFFNPFCIQANIDRHTRTHTHTRAASYIRPKRDHQPAWLCVLIILSHSGPGGTLSARGSFKVLAAK